MKTQKHITRSFLLITVLFFTQMYFTSAQSIQYILIEDNPDALSENFINAEILGIDYGANGTDGNVYVGGNIFWSLTEKLKAEGLLRITAFNFTGSGLGIQSEGGLFFPIINQRKVKSVPVVLKTTLFAGRDEQNRSYDETKFFEIDGTYKNQIGPRGGIYFKKTGYNYEENSLDVASTSMTLVGSYFGIEKLTQAFVKTKVKEQFKYGAGQTRIYFDVLMIPSRSFADQLVTDPERDGSFGWRVGMQWNQRPHKTKQGFEKRPVYSAELGKRPFTGLYINVSIGLMLKS